MVAEDVRTEFRIVNPANGLEIAKYEGHSSEEAISILESVGIAARQWRGVSIEDRAPFFHRIAAKLREQSRRIAILMANEMGKPVRQGLAEVEKCALCCEFYAEQAAVFLRDEPLTLANAYTHYEPLGAVLAVMPWNFPFWQVFRCLCPALMAGNAMVLKHASNVMGCAVLIEEVVISAGLPANLFRTLKISSSQVAGVIRNPVISAVTLTGSEPAGKSIASETGACLKPVVLELGGSDPFLVLDDANVEEAARVAVTARCQNTGQSCIASKRFLVQDSVYDAFLKVFVSGTRALKVGDPLDEATDVGPLARRDLRDELHDQVRRSLAAGAELLLGGELPTTPGAFYPPTILAGVGPGIAAFDEETFGPVAAVVRFDDEEQGINLANASRFGLGASVWTADLQRARAVAARIESGMVFVNQMTRSDNRLPFGGIKASGFGRELWVQGIRSFTNAKTIYVD